jgi:hypothetical protein
MAGLPYNGDGNPSMHFRLSLLAIALKITIALLAPTLLALAAERVLRARDEA